jgi:hypothetical protein
MAEVGRGLHFRREEIMKLGGQGMGKISYTREQPWKTRRKGRGSIF